MIENDIDRLYELLNDLDATVEITNYGIMDVLRDFNKRLRKLEARYDKTDGKTQSIRMHERAAGDDDRDPDKNA